jgi:NodT family efflux transporter outer membrane factor (OMF) lipoprotein
MRVDAGKLGLAILAAVAVSACAVGPNFHAPAPPDTAHYTRAPEPVGTVATEGRGGTAQTLSADRDIPADWWTVFHCEPLDALVRQSLADNPSVQAASATLRNAAETWRAERGGLLLPAVDAQAQAVRQKEPGAVLGQPGLPPLTFSLFDVSVGVTYRLDLFGASRRQIEALRAQTDYQRYELEAAYLTLAGNVVTTAVNIASLHAQISALTEIIASEHDQMKVVQRQFDAGAASRSDVLAQQTQVASNEALLPGLQKQLAQAQHRLAVLAGRTPDDTQLPDFTLEELTLPAELPLSVPAKLVRQRPDVQAAEALLHQSTAQLGVATANLYPQLNLTGSVGSETTSASDLFKSGSGAWNIGGTLLQPLFHGGELRGLKRAARADLDRATAQYRQAVLSALQDVADTLRALEADARTLQAQATTEADARDALAITKLQYQAGGVSYLALLNAQRTYLQARQVRIQAEAARYADTAALFQALGGGWWNRENGKESRL